MVGCIVKEVGLIVDEKCGLVVIVGDRVDCVGDKVDEVGSKVKYVGDDRGWVVWALGPVMGMGMVTLFVIVFVLVVFWLEKVVGVRGVCN